MDVRLVYAAMVAGILALIFAFLKTRWINRQDSGNQALQDIGAAVREGAMAFLSRQYRVLLVFVLITGALLYFFNKGDARWVGVAFLVGAFCSALSGYFGMRVATAANMRTAHKAEQGLQPALEVAFSGGSVMGMSVVGLALLGIGIMFWWLTDMLGMEMKVMQKQVLQILSGFSLGASSIALFARVGGGIFTKAADVGADLVGKLEAGIPEDDARNPATVADNVGDNVGDVAGMGADLFESYAGAIIGAMILGAAAHSYELITLPLALAALGILVSVLGTFFVRTREGGNPQLALNMGTLGAGALLAALAYPLIMHLAPATFTLARRRTMRSDSTGRCCPAWVAASPSGCSRSFTRRRASPRSMPSWKLPLRARPPTSSPGWRWA
jgi:K(+)-stimulated pyrophosphate-energized sodium pump